MLHQIKVYIKDLVARDKLPEIFTSIIPENVCNLAAAVFDDSEKGPRYPEV